MSTELTGGHGVYMGEARPPDLEARSVYVQREYARRRHRRRRTRRSARWRHDGRWKFVAEMDSAGSHAWILVRAPAEGERVQRHRDRRVAQRERRRRRRSRMGEPREMEEEIVRGGRRVGRRLGQRIGVEGGPGIWSSVPGVPGAERRRQGPQGDRPGAPTAPSSIRATRTPRTSTPKSPARSAPAPDSNGLRPQRLIAAGESQSAFALVTYYNGVQPLTHAFDGFFVHSRGASGFPPVVPGKNADIARADRGHVGDLPDRSGRADTRHPDRDRCRQHPRLVRARARQ